MTEQFVTVAQLRAQLEIAQTLAKSHVAFVVIPVATEEGFAKLCVHQAQKLEHLAQIAEREKAGA